MVSTTLKPSKKNTSLFSLKGGKASSSPATQLRYDSLKAHNECRRKHNVAPLEWSETLAKNAQKWADHLGEHGKFEHAHINQRKGEGENIFCGKGGRIDGDIATKKWYSEIEDFDFTQPPTYVPNTGHFTQVVWASTTQLGVGRSKATDGTEYIVARYAPPGNNLNDFVENIKPPVDDVPLHGTNDDDNEYIDNCDESDPEREIADECLDNSMEENELDEIADECLDNSMEENELSEYDLSTEEEVTSTPACTVSFQQRLVVPEVDHFPRCEIIELSILTDEVKKACFRKRKHAYLQCGVSYVLIHGYYE